MNESIKRYGSIIGVGVAAVIASRLLAPSTPTPTVASAPVRIGLPDVDITRIVSCGDMHGAARLSGTDEAGTIMLGTGADGRCTVLFAKQHERACTLSGGIVEKLTPSDLVVSGVTGGMAYYSCK